MENYIRSENAKIWTDISGAKNDRHVVLCNGGPGCCDYLLPVSQMIDDGYNVIRFEQRGCGRSDKDGRYDIMTALSDLEAIRNYYGVDSWIVGGHSWGAALSLLYAILHPERTSSLLFIAGLSVQNNKEWYAEFIANRGGEVLPDFLYPFNEEVNKAGNASFRKYIQSPGLYRDISKLPMPALFMCAKKDIRPNWQTEQISALIEKSKLVCIAQAAHYIWLTHYDEMRLELRKFLRLPL
ncbi:MAG: alpha/beta hydrolase [Clostridiales bacterium]|jgi:proline iminopeptidase|nr:alpha/beta hydrolase [Clostridiales bacterium]